MDGIVESSDDVCGGLPCQNGEVLCIVMGHYELFKRVWSTVIGIHRSLVLGGLII